MSDKGWDGRKENNVATWPRHARLLSAGRLASLEAPAVVVSDVVGVYSVESITSQVAINKTKKLLAKLLLHSPPNHSMMAARI